MLERFESFIPGFFLKGFAMYIGAVTLFTVVNCGEGSDAIFSSADARPSG